MSLLFLLASFFLCQLVLSSFAICPRDQSLALVEFNHSFVVDASASLFCDKQSYPKTSSWNMNKDCCSWDGIICDEMTGHVIELDLSCSQLVGKIDSNSSLFQLSHLQRLNLSMNDFDGSHLSPKFGMLASLTHLDLSWADFSGLYGIIPESIFNLPNLETLDLSYNDQLNGYFPKTKWNSSASLMELNLVGVPKCLWNLTHLEYMDLQDNRAKGPLFPQFTSGLQNLNTLRLSNNSLNGEIPSWIFSLPLLSQLDLSNNHFSGQLKEFSNNSVLVGVDISENEMQGCLPKSIQNLVSLVWIILANNQLQCPSSQVTPEPHKSKIT
ncbi:hypothetical protein H5410_058850 [Solanum commersonii]|uniref:Leucine-rich repeat-containing N-terminal plant-type domain-containing protein n=1 Tax=Solanum commersonii TaxID=4109 RepID=A0A9J5W159_SOLCO|nr:hypothetical protein H5410_058850 [Solanum commersonii]